MANQYDARRRKIERERMIAAALRASGNEPLPASRQTSGRFDAPVSTWEHASRALDKIMGGYQEGRANRAEQKLDADQAAAQAAWVDQLDEAQTPDEIQPIQSTGELITPTMDDTIRNKLREITSAQTEAELNTSPAAPIETQDPAAVFQEQQARQLSAANTYNEATKASDSADRKRLLAHAMRGADLGGMPAAIGANIVERQLFPAKPVITTIDTGSSVILLKDGIPAKEIRKSATPDATANRIAAEAARLQGQEFTAAQNEANRSVTRRGQDISAQNAQAARDAAAKKTTAPEADAKTKLGQVNAARESVAKLTESSAKLSDWQTGPITGRRPAISDLEQTFEADVALVTGQILAATKVPGTGAQSDRDAARLDALTPQLKDDAKARNRKIEGLSRWLDEIERTNAEMAGGTASAAPRSNLPTKNAKGWTLQQDASGNQAYVSPDGKQFEEAR